MASAEADLEANPVAAPTKKNIEQVNDEIDPDEDPTGICCGVFDPPTGFEKREVVRISNRKVDEIKAEIIITLKKFGAFIVWFYVVLYIFCLVMQAAMGVTIKGNAPFDSARFDWDGDEGIAVGVGTILGHLFTCPAVLLIIREGQDFEYDKVWDFVATLAAFHLIITCIVDLEFPTEGLWWATQFVGFMVLWLLGWYVCTRYWHMAGLERLVTKVGRMNVSKPLDP